jgi:hypothetical protein
VQLELPLGLEDEKRRPGAKRGIARWTADRAVDKIRNSDRLFLIQLYRWFPSVLMAITIIRPETAVRWHRAGFRQYWRWKSRSLGGRPQIDSYRPCPCPGRGALAPNPAILRALLQRIEDASLFEQGRSIPWTTERIGAIMSRPILGGLRHQYCRI